MNLHLLLADFLSQRGLLLCLSNSFLLELVSHVFFESRDLLSFLIRRGFGLSRLLRSFLRLSLLHIELPLLLHAYFLSDLEFLLLLPEHLHVLGLLHVHLRVARDFLLWLRLADLGQFHLLLVLDILQVEELRQVLFALLANQFLIDDLLRQVIVLLIEIVDLLLQVFHLNLLRQVGLDLFQLL